MAIEVAVSMGSNLTSYEESINENCFKNAMELGVHKTTALLNRTEFLRLHSYALCGKTSIVESHMWPRNPVTTVSPKTCIEVLLSSDLSSQVSVNLWGPPMQ